MTNPLNDPDPNTTVPRDEAAPSEVEGRKTEPNTTVPQDKADPNTTVPQDIS